MCLHPSTSDLLSVSKPVAEFCEIRYRRSLQKVVKQACFAKVGSVTVILYLRA